MSGSNRGVAALLSIPRDQQQRDLLAALRDAGLFLHRPDPDEYIVASTTLDPDEDRPSTVRVVRDEPAGWLRVELVWAGGPPRSSAVDRALAVVRSVSDRLPNADRSAQADEITGNFERLQRLWTAPEPDTGASVRQLRPQAVTVTFDRMDRMVVGHRKPPPMVVRRAHSEGLEVLVSGDPRADTASVAISATGPQWPGSLVGLTVVDGAYGETTYVVALLGAGGASSGRVIVSARSNDAVEVNVDVHPRPVADLSADDAPAIRRSLSELDQAAQLFWLDLADSRPADDPISTAIDDGLA